MAETKSIIETAQERLTNSYARRNKTELKSIDPITISILLELAASLLKMCMKQNNNAADRVKAVIKHPVLARFRIRQEIRASAYQSRPDREAIVETLLDAGESTSVEEINSFVEAVDFNV